MPAKSSPMNIEKNLLLMLNNLFQNDFFCSGGGGSGVGPSSSISLSTSSNSGMSVCMGSVGSGS